MLNAESVCEQYRPLIFKLAYRAAKGLPASSPLDGEDLVQEGMAAVLVALPKYEAHRSGDPAQGGLVNWIAVVVRHRFCRVLRTEQRRSAPCTPVAPAVLARTPIAPEQEVVGALYDGLRAGRLVVGDRYRRLRRQDLVPSAGAREPNR